MMLELDESVPEAQTVDCQLSASDGVIVQVTGNLQCKVRVPVLGVMYASCAPVALLQPACSPCREEDHSFRIFRALCLYSASFMCAKTDVDCSSMLAFECKGVMTQCTCA